MAFLDQLSNIALREGEKQIKSVATGLSRRLFCTTYKKTIRRKRPIASLDKYCDIGINNVPTISSLLNETRTSLLQ